MESSDASAGVKQAVGGVKVVVRGPTFVRDHPDHAMIVKKRKLGDQQGQLMGFQGF